MYKVILVLLLIVLTLNAAEKEEPLPYSVRIGYGYSDSNDLGDILMGDWNHYDGDTSALNIDGGYCFSHDTWDLPLDFYAKGGLSYFNENSVLNVHTGEISKDFLEVNVYVKVYLKLDFWQNRVRIGVGEGVSLAQEVPVVEVDDATNNDGTMDPTAKFLNYLDISADFDVGRLIRVNALRDTYLGYTLKHRSGVFGTFNGVHGGSNYNMLTLEKNF
jgi:outer membrane protein